MYQEAAISKRLKQGTSINSKTVPIQHLEKSEEQNRESGVSDDNDEGEISRMDSVLDDNELIHESKLELLQSKPVGFLGF